MKLGCHCVLFGPRIASEPENILEALSKTGFEGVEMGARFIGSDRNPRIISALEANHLQLSALHVAIPMEMWESDPDKAIGAVLNAAHTIAEFPNKNLTMSGTPSEKAIEVAKAMNTAALRCKELGVSLNYHNHAAEFLVNGGAMYKALRDYAPEMKFGFDLGWVMKSGYDVYDVLEENKGRVHYVHLRDYDTRQPSEEELAQRGQHLAYLGGNISRIFPDIGDGIVDFRKLLHYLSGYLPADGWAVVEYETGEQDVSRYTRAYRLLHNMLIE